MAPMDLFLTILDSKWDGFLIEVPFEKEPIPYVVPLHDLLTNTRGFSFLFPGSSALQASGDLPFLSITTLLQYTEVLRGEELSGKDFIRKTVPGLTARQEFDGDTVYLSRYKSLIDLIVRALVSPEIPFPEYLSVYDYPKGAPPAARDLDISFDVPRRHALLLWAALGEDPEALADWLFEEVFSKEENAYPLSVSLPVAFLTAVREHEPELLAAVAKRIEEARAGSGEGNENSFLSADFEREFSPFPVLLSTEGAPGATALAHSFQYFHEPLAETIRQAAYAAILEKL